MLIHAICQRVHPVATSPASPARPTALRLPCPHSVQIIRPRSSRHQDAFGTLRASAYGLGLAPSGPLPSVSTLLPLLRLRLRGLRPCIFILCHRRRASLRLLQLRLSQNAYSNKDWGVRAPLCGAFADFDNPPNAHTMAFLRQEPSRYRLTCAALRALLYGPQRSFPTVANLFACCITATGKIRRANAATHLSATCRG